MLRIDAEQVSHIIVETARQVILPRFRHLEKSEIREKNPGDFVTIADTEAERLLSSRLGDLLPGSRVVGEEAVAANPAVLDLLTEDDPVWIIDPVDGTRNFAHGRPLFCVIVALVWRRRTMMGWIHDPLSGRTVTAAQGEGAWNGGERLRVADEAPLSAMRGSVGCRKRERLQQAVQGLLRQGSAGHDYLALAEARMHFAYFRRLRPWDHAAGVLLHQEAGGYSALTDGAPYQPLYTDSGMLLAPGRASWDALRVLL